MSFYFGDPLVSLFMVVAAAVIRATHYQSNFGCHVSHHWKAIRECKELVWVQLANWLVKEAMARGCSIVIAKQSKQVHFEMQQNDMIAITSCLCFLELLYRLVTKGPQLEVISVR